ncbi:vanadium-dependent haloperoxidase [Aureimonas sp. SK2]|uniref:vanadium-dependent haloperoxidase n=1 Tax=Aureimonas sp. SK2 TaxID=3015992 RepID=UPI002443D1B0|nr:vanadium-dependent haloperoxidase [Aureimonas sp. SK2]
MLVTDTIVVRWNDVLLKALEIGTNEKSLRLGPPMVARLLSMVYTAAFQAWSSYDHSAKPPLPGGPGREPVAKRTLGNKNVAISHAIYRTSLDLFPNSRIKALLDGHMTSLGLDIESTATTGSGPAVIGNAAAKAVLAARADDGANQAGNRSGSPPPAPDGSRIPYADYTGYAAVNQPAMSFSGTSRAHVTEVARWQPLSYIDPSVGMVTTPAFIGPHWGQVKPFSLTSGDEFRPSPPESFTSQAFLDQARYVVEVQQRLSLEQKIVAEYWADGPRSLLPPGHWCEIAGEVSRHDLHDVDKDAKLFFALSNSILDASIATWEAKRFYDYVRPITAIRWLYAGFTIDAWGGPGLGTTKVRGEKWRPFQKDTFPTPPFPEYCSGHSAFSMAAATVLKHFRSVASGRSLSESDRFPLEHLQELPLAADPDINGLPVRLTWETFTEAAISAGESRIFGGIHFYQGNVAGLDLGRKVGEKAWAKAQSFF